MHWLSDIVKVFGSYCLGKWMFNAHAYFRRICIKESKEIFRNTIDSQ